MLLKLKNRGVIVKVTDIPTLLDPYAGSISGRLQWGEEEQDREEFAKRDLCFLSGEDLPQCWVDCHYRDHEVNRRRCGTHSDRKGFDDHTGV
jgi:hypothetical protein